MNRQEFLTIERKKIIEMLNSDKRNRAKWVAALIDIDDEIEQISKELKSLSFRGIKPITRLS